MEYKTRIIIADDHPIVRHGLRQVIDAESTFQVIAEANNGQSALEKIDELKPQIALLDMDMPALDGLAVAREIGQRKLAVEFAFLTIHADEDLFHAAMDLGSRGYILKESALDEIIQALRTIASGQYYVSPPLTAHLLSRRRRVQALAQGRPQINDLTPAERRVLRGISEGKSSKQIGAELFVHVRTVETHRANICQKLGLHGHNALFKFALENKSELFSF